MKYNIEVKIAKHVYTQWKFEMSWEIESWIEPHIQF